MLWSSKGRIRPLSPWQLSPPFPCVHTGGAGPRQGSAAGGAGGRHRHFAGVKPTPSRHRYLVLAPVRCRKVGANGKTMTILRTFELLELSRQLQAKFQNLFTFHCAKDKKRSHTSGYSNYLLEQTPTAGCFESRDEHEEEHSDYKDQLVLMGAKGSSEVGNQEAQDPPLS